MILTSENYYSPESNREYFSVSGWKSMRKCESKYMAELDGKYKREGTIDAFIIGSYLDAAIEGTLDEYKKNTPELYQKNGHMYAKYQIVDTMLKRATGDKKFMRSLNGDKQKIVTGDIEGAKWKGKLDVYNEGHFITDLKTIDTISNIAKWGYEYQGAVYQELIRQETGEKLPFYLAVISKEKVPRLAIIQIPQNILDPALDEVRWSMEHLIQVKNGEIPPEECGKCDWCATIQPTEVLNYQDFL